MRVLFLIGREPSYQRNDVMLRCLNKIVDVDIVAFEKPRSILLRSLLTLFKAIPLLIFKKYDLVYIGFYGYLLIFPVRLVTKIPIVFDAFLSNYDTLCFDRKIFKPDSFFGRLAFYIDRKACFLADVVLLDTQLHVDYFINSLKIEKNKLHAIPVGCNEELFFPGKSQNNKSQVEILYYCSYLPLHGADIVVKAACILKDNPNIKFKLIGFGLDYARVKKIALSNSLKNISFLPFIPIQSIPEELNKADICLAGHFGNSSKASRVVPGKLYQMMAMAKPIIAGDTPANRELLVHGDNAMLCKPGDESALAKSILELSCNKDIRLKFKININETYQIKCSEAVIQRMIQRIIFPTNKL